jgi:hypothetical protein
MMHSPGASGTMSIDEALTSALDGTSLAFRRSGSVATIEIGRISGRSHGPVGSMVLYPSTSLHHVRPVTRGAHVPSFFWLQSMVRDDGERTLLFDLDNAISTLSQSDAHQPVAVQLTGVYHNLLRKWAEL